MLPGLRFLFAATLMSASLLIFGMGAIALMRASHQQFASAPPRPAPEPVFAQAPQTVPSLSMLRAEPTAVTSLDPASASERVAALTSAERAAEPPPPPLSIAEPKSAASGEPASDAPPPADPPPMPAVTPLVEKPAAPDSPPAAIAETAESLKQDVAAAPEPASPETTPAAQPAQIASAPESAIAAVAPTATGSIAMPEDQPVEPQVVVVDPPLPQARPEIAVVSPVAEPARPKVTPKAVVKRKVRKAKRHRAKSEKLPAVSSAPTLGSLFSSSSN